GRLQRARSRRSRDSEPPPHRGARVRSLGQGAAHAGAARLLHQALGLPFAPNQPAGRRSDALLRSRDDPRLRRRERRRTQPRESLPRESASGDPGAARGVQELALQIATTRRARSSARRPSLFRLAAMQPSVYQNQPTRPAFNPKFVYLESASSNSPVSAFGTS